MGLYDPLKGSAAAAGAATGAAVSEQQAVSSLLGEKGAGLSGLLEKLKATGLEDTVTSWIGKGANKPLSADQIKAALTNDQVQAVAAKLGISKEAAAGKIAAILPSIVDKLTPDGLVPDPAAIAGKLTGLLKL